MKTKNRKGKKKEKVVVNEVIPEEVHLYMIRLVKKDPTIFKLLEPDLREDRRIIKVAIGECSEMAEYVNKRLLNNRMFMCPLIKKDTFLLSYAGENITSDYDFMLSCYKKSTFDACEYVHQDLLNKRKFILECLAHSIHIYNKIPKKFIKDKDIWIAIFNNFDLVKYESHRRSLCGDIVTTYHHQLPNNLKNDLEINKLALSKSIYVLEDLHEDLQGNYDLIEPYIKKHYTFLGYFDNKWKNNKEYMLKLMRLDVRVFQYASMKIRSDFDVAEMVVAEKPSLIQYVTGFTKHEYMKLAKMALNEDGLLLEYMEPWVRSDEIAVTLAIENNPEAIEYCGAYRESGMSIDTEKKLWMMAIDKIPDLIWKISYNISRHFFMDLLSYAFKRGAKIKSKYCLEWEEHDEEIILTAFRNGNNGMKEFFYLDDEFRRYNKIGGHNINGQDWAYIAYHSKYVKYDEYGSEYFNGHIDDWYYSEYRGRCIACNRWYHESYDKCSLYQSKTKEKRAMYVKEFEDRLKKRNQMIDTVVRFAATAGEPSVKTMLIRTLENQGNTNISIKFSTH